MGEVAGLSPPEPLAPHHDVSSFASGEPQLDLWLKQRAQANEQSGASRTYVVCVGSRVVGYYALATGGIAREHALGKVRRNMPDPIPVMVIGRLAIDTGFQGHGIGSSLLLDAIRRTLRASRIAGIRAILVHAISDRALEFYLKWGFHAAPTDPTTLMITIGEAAAIEDSI